MVQKVKEKKGFTLAELLVVVAIIGVLVAVSIPIFTSQLEKARRATNQANARAAMAAATVDYLEKNPAPTTDTVYVYTIATGKGVAGTEFTTKTVDVKNANTQSDYPGDDVYKKISVKLDKDGTVTKYGFSND